MKNIRIFISLMCFFIMCVACSSSEDPIKQESILGKWIVTNEEVDMNKFIADYGKIHILEAMRIQQHFTEGAVIEFLPDGTVNFGSIPAKYTVENQDESNSINIIGEASESNHPIKIKKDDKLQLSVFVLKRSTK